MNTCTTCPAHVHSRLYTHATTLSVQCCIKSMPNLPGNWTITPILITEALPQVPLVTRNILGLFRVKKLHCYLRTEWFPLIKEPSSKNSMPFTPFNLKHVVRNFATKMANYSQHVFPIFLTVVCIYLSCILSAVLSRRWEAK